ncbi:hypothetical protein LBMAG53_15430 [Planctomycetota bacterium]|nr:hypothetical protein LBMAG53_15430 [Planctomycetota bacterium]
MNDIDQQKTGPGTTEPVIIANAGNPNEKPRQSTLDEATGEPLPSGCFPEPTEDESSEREKLARIMRDYAMAHPGDTFNRHDAAGWAGWKLPTNCRGNAVCGPGVNLARLRGWIVRCGPAESGPLLPDHGGLLRKWKNP